MKRLIEGQLNPVIAGFDILFLGARGFTTLARAKRAKIRNRGKKREKWIEFKFTKRHKTKAQKEYALYTLLKKLSYARDLKKKTPAAKKKEKKKLAKRISKKRVPQKFVPPVSEAQLEEVARQKAPKVKRGIKFTRSEKNVKVIVTRAGKNIEIKKYDYKLKKDLIFSKGQEYEAPVVSDFIQSVKEEFKKLYKQYGHRDYLIRLHHEYKNFVNYYDAFPEALPHGATKKDVEDKGFGGFSLHRQKFTSLAQIDDQFDSILAMKYLSSFSRYLNFSNPSTEFNFSGFMVEVTLKVVPKPKRVRIKRQH